MNWYKTAYDQNIDLHYPVVGSELDGLSVSGDVPNMGSIGATLNDYEVLDGIRSIPMSEFDGPQSVFYAADDLRRSRELAQEIKRSNRIDPLIVVLDKDGPYLLEGSHRYVALFYLGVQHLPALLVVDQAESDSEEQ